MADDVNKQKSRQKRLNSAYYKVQFGVTEVNKRKKLRRHLRSFPNDTAAAKAYVALGGKPRDLAELAPTHKGRKVLKREAYFKARAEASQHRA